MSDPLLVVRDLVVARGRQRVISGLSGAVQAGEVVMLIGPNGAGKSTLLGALGGDLRPVSGQLLLAGRPLSRWPARELARHRSLLRQHSSLSLDFTVREVVQLGCMARQDPAPVQRERVARAMALTGVVHLADSPVPSLSGGEQARTHLARVLAQLWPDAAMPGAPRLLLLDEPCASLDPRYQHLVCGVVRDFAAQAGCAAVMTMHDMNLAAQYADRVWVLHEGRKVADGPAAEVLDPALIRRCFAVDACHWSHHRRGVLATVALDETPAPLR